MYHLHWPEIPSPTPKIGNSNKISPISFSIFLKQLLPLIISMSRNFVQGNKRFYQKIYPNG